MVVVAQNEQEQHRVVELVDVVASKKPTNRSCVIDFEVQIETTVVVVEETVVEVHVTTV